MDWSPFRAAVARHGVGRILAVDVGAREGVGDRWTALGDLVEVHGFEPDEAECARLNATAPRNVRYVPIALAEAEREATLHLTVEPACASLHPPLRAVSELLPGSACTAPAGTRRVAVRTVDAWREANGVLGRSVMKLDVQGAELDVLRGAERALAAVQLLEVEVEFNPIYAGQPLFGDVDRHLRERGFVLWRLSEEVHYADAGLAGLKLRMRERAAYDLRRLVHERRAGQLYWAHAYFTRSELAPASPATIGAAQAIRAAVVALAYGLHDLAHVALRKVAAGTDAFDAGPLVEAVVHDAARLHRLAKRAARLDRLRPRWLWRRLRRPRGP